MKKLLIGLMLFLFFSELGHCELSSTHINKFKLKHKNLYLLDTKSEIKNIEVSNSKILNIQQIKTANDKSKQLFIEASEKGKCDVKITTADNEYKIRFKTGKFLEDKNDSITKIDLPTKQ